MDAAGLKVTPAGQLSKLPLLQGMDTKWASYGPEKIPVWRQPGSGREGMTELKQRSLVSYTFSNMPLPWPPGVAWKEGSLYSVLWFQDTSASLTSRGSSAQAASSIHTACIPAHVTESLHLGVCLMRHVSNGRRISFQD